MSVDGNDLSAYTDTSTFNVGADVHDLTTYGQNNHVFQGGLGNNTGQMSGTYDNTAGTGPRAVLKPRVGTTVVVVRRPEGTGSAKPQDSVSAVISSYVETNPVADFVKWSCEFQCSGTVDATAQA
jgi:hypothetical protein